MWPSEDFDQEHRLDLLAAADIIKSRIVVVMFREERLMNPELRVPTYLVESDRGPYISKALAIMTRVSELRYSHRELKTSERSSNIISSRVRRPLSIRQTGARNRVYIISFDSHTSCSTKTVEETKDYNNS
jgi:hypothetical protein